MIRGSTPGDTFLRTSSRFLIWLEEQNAAGLRAFISLYFTFWLRMNLRKAVCACKDLIFVAEIIFESSAPVGTGLRITHLTQDRSQKSKQEEKLNSGSEYLMDKQETVSAKSPTRAVRFWKSGKWFPCCECSLSGWLPINIRLWHFRPSGAFCYSVPVLAHLMCSTTFKSKKIKIISCLLTSGPIFLQKQKLLSDYIMFASNIQQSQFTITN